MITKEKFKLTQRGKVKNHIFKGVGESLKELIYSFNDAIVYFDPDVDGCISGVLVCRFLTMHGIKYKYYINSNRSHDWSIPLNNLKNQNVIAVDFMIHTDKVKNIVSSDCNLVSIDHHNNQDTFIYHENNGYKGLVINNQYPFEPNDGRYLSGAGVVFEVLIALDPSFDTVENRALVGITLLSDTRNIENPYAEGYLYNTYSHPYKGYIKYLIDGTMGEIDYGFGLPKMDRNYIDFKFSPAINAMLRFNREDEVVEFLFNKGKIDMDCLKNQKELLKKLKNLVKVVDFSKLRVCYFFENDILEYSEYLSNFIGLCASKFLDSVRSVICYMIVDSPAGRSVKRASFRGNINGLDYRSSLSSQFLCLGHSSAFGIKKIKPEKDLFKRCNLICKELEDTSDWKRKVINVVNLSMFVNNNSARKIAEDNMYLLGQNMTYLRYTGGSIEKKRSSANYLEYLVNGVTVKCFDPNIDFKTGLISVILDRGLVTFYLE